MKKTLGMIALTGGLVAAGCAMLPTTGAKAPAGQPTAVGLSGPGSAYINMNGDRGIQAIAGGAKEVVARVYEADATYGSAFAASGSAAAVIEQYQSKVLMATASVVSGTANLVLPPLPAGKHVIKLDAYKFAGMVDAAGADTASASTNLVAQSEAYVQTVVGLPYKATFPLFMTFATTVDASPSSGTATLSVQAPAVVAGTTGLFLRMANWNYYANTASNSLRLVITHPTAFAANLASGSAGTYGIGDVKAAKGFTTGSIPAWSWTNDRKYLYTDLTFLAASASEYASNSYTVKTTGSLSLSLPAVFAPSGYKLTVIDAASGSSLDGGSTLN
ncbi:MAG TPA: hypothetical protein V6D00_13155 [Pantanalinema sp.]